jgi:solute carrier family 10 (sodium/bile acid cotransporter), member 7
VSPTDGPARKGWSSRLKPDAFVLTLVAAVVAASLLPVRGEAAEGLGLVSKLAIGLLFFLHGARLPRDAVVKALIHWRLHLTVLAITFALFPLLGLIAAFAARPLLPEPLPAGLIFLACLPSTVQSSIAFTSAARGNVAAAVTSASLSNVLGMFVTPLLVAVLLGAHGHAISFGAMQAIFLQLLAPFIAGQLLRPWVGGWVHRRKRLLTFTDRGTIALLVYLAFSAAVVGGVWTRVSAAQLAIVLAACVGILAAVMAASTLGARRLGFDREDEIAIVFCGSKKTITGVAIAGILFAPAVAGVIVLPLMIFHQLQLMVCAVLAQRYARRPATAESQTPAQVPERVQA